MATLGDLRLRVSAKIGLDNNVPGDQQLLDSWINEGVTDVLLRTHCKVLPAQISLAVGQGDYVLDLAILQIVDAYLGSTSLERVRPEEIIDMRKGAGGRSSYAVAGLNLLMLYPTPSSASVLNLYYVPRPLALSASTASPDEIVPEFHKAVEYYALMQAADYDDDESSEQGRRYSDEYEKWIRLIRVAMDKRGGNELPKFKVGASTPVRTHPSQDLW